MKIAKEEWQKYMELETNNLKVLEFLNYDNLLDGENYFRCKNIYEYIEGMSRHYKVQYNGYIDKTYFKEIEKFLKFYIVAFLKVYKTGEVNLKQASARIYKFSEEDIEGIGYDDIYNNPKILDGCDNFIRFYEKLTRDFSNATIEKEVLKLSGIKISKIKNYEGKKIKVHSIKEMKALNIMFRARLDGIENSKEAEKAYKKIRNNKVNIMTDKNYNELYTLLNNNIEGMQEEFKNIYYYKLERRQQYELRKVILKNINKLSTNEEKIKYINYSTAYLVPNPVLTIRESLANKLYNAIDRTSKYSMKQFESESVIIMDLIKKSIKQIVDVIYRELVTLEYIENGTEYYEKSEETDKKLVVDIKEKLKKIGKNITYLGFFTADDIEEFKKIYNENGTRREFQNNYKIKKDYTAEDVKLYSQIIHSINQYQKEKIVDSLKNSNLK